MSENNNNLQFLPAIGIENFYPLQTDKGIKDNFIRQLALVIIGGFTVNL